MDRRTSLEALGGVIVAGSVFAWSRTARNEKGEPLLLPDADRGFEPDSPVTAITLGEGFRGNV